MKKFTEKPHDWNEILIDYNGRRISRGQIKNYYEKTINKLYPYLKNRKVIVILGVGKNKFVLKRLIKPGGPNIYITKKFGIDDPHSIEYWINRRTIEFHPIIGTKTDKIWVDIDVHDGKTLNIYAKRVAKDVAKILKKHFPGHVTIWDSGKNGIHIEDALKESVGTDSARKKLRHILDNYAKGNERITTGLAKHGMIRLDITTLKKTGSIRAPYSFTVTGNFKGLIK